MDATDLRRQKTAYRLIQKEGRSVTLKVLTDGDYDPATATSNDVLAQYPMKALLETRVRGQRGHGGTAFSTDLAMNTAVFVTIPAYGLSVVPKPGDVVMIDSFDWRVLSSTPTRSKDTPVLYDLYCNR